MGAESQEIWIALGVAIFVIAVFCIAMLAPRRDRPVRSVEAKVDVLSHRLDEVERSTAQAEHDIRNVRMSVAGLATKDTVNLVAVQVAEMRGEVKSVVQNTAATTRQVELVMSFLMKSAADSIAGNKSQSNGS